MSVFDGIRSAAKKILKSIKPMTLNEWAETHGYLSAESSADPGPWRSIPYQKFIMDLISDDQVERVVIKKSARVGYTKILLHCIGYFSEQVPSSILIVQPSDIDAEGFSKEELATYIRDVKVLNEIYFEAKSRDGGNTILQKFTTLGGVLSLTGANTPRGFRRISRRVILLDEVSGFPRSAGVEGDPVNLAIRRSEYFWNRKVVMGSTPKMVDDCRITEAYLETDQGKVYFPCPTCGHYQTFQWKNFKWPDDNPRDAYFVCEKNGCLIEHKHKRGMLEKGEIRSTTVSSNPKWRGVELNAFMSLSPNSTWGDIALEFLEKKKTRETLIEFVNTVLGEPFDDTFAERNRITDLQARSEGYAMGSAPEKVLFCTAGVDCQDNRLAVSIFGWTHEDECFVLSYQEIYGNPGETAVWKALDALLTAPIIHEKYKDMYIRAAAIDSGGHFTHEVYQYTRERRDKNFLAVRGASQRGKPAIGKPSIVDINFRGKSLKRGAAVYNIGTDTVKSVIYSRLKILEKGPKYIHFSFELGEDYYKGLQSERKVTKFKSGQRVTVWEKLSSTSRNEPLDTFVYGFAAKEFILTKYPKKLAYSLVEKELELKTGGEKVTVKKASKPKKPTGGGFATSW